MNLLINSFLINSEEFHSNYIDNIIYAKNISNFNKYSEYFCTKRQFNGLKRYIAVFPLTNNIMGIMMLSTTKQQ